MATDWGIYQLLGRGVTPLDPLGSFQQAQQNQQRSAVGQLALQEARRQQQEQARLRDIFRQEYGGQGAPTPALPAPPASTVGQLQPGTESFPPLAQQEAAATQQALYGTPPGQSPGQAPDRGPGQAPPGPSPMPAPMARAAVSGLQPGGVDRSRLVRRLYSEVGPAAGMTAEKHFSDAEKSAAESYSAQLDMYGKQHDMVAQVARGILQEDTQAGYERGITVLRQMRIPTEHLPAVYDRRMVEQYETMMTDMKSQIDQQKNAIAQQRLQQETVTETRLQKQYELDVAKGGREERKAAREETKAEREEREAAQAVPKYTGDSTLNVGIDQLMKERGLTGPPPADVLAQAQKNVQEGKVSVSRAQGEAGALAKPLEGPALHRVNMLMQGEDVVKALQTEFTPDERRKYIGLGGARMTVQQAQQLLADATEGKADPKFARFVALLALGKQEAFSTAGSALSQQEREVVFGYIPTGREWSAEEFEQKLTLSGQRLPTLIDRELTISTTPREQLAERRRRGELPTMTPTTPAPQLIPMTEEMIADAMRQTEKSRAEVLDLARKTKKYRVPEQ